MSLTQPSTPAVANYPTASPYASQMEASRERFLKELSSDDGWTELGEKQGVTLSKKSIVSPLSRDAARPANNGSVADESFQILLRKEVRPPTGPGDQLSETRPLLRR